jgi:hypothetical protein
VLVHRYSYYLHCGKFNKSLHVLHRCDNPLCVNPKHLFLGTNLDNVKDKMKKGRSNSPKGESVNTSKLKEREVVIIKKQLLKGETIYSLANKYSVNPWTINDIKVGKNWKHIQV